MNLDGVMQDLSQIRVEVIFPEPPVGGVQVFNVNQYMTQLTFEADPPLELVIDLSP